MHRNLCLLAMFVFVAPAFGQELLTNPSFDDPPLIGGPDCAIYGPRDTQLVTAWWQNNQNKVSRQLGGTGAYDFGRNVEVGAPHTCDGNGHASMCSWMFSWPDNGIIYQNVSGLEPAKTYTFSGEWTVGFSAGAAVVSAELHNGHDIDPTNNTTLIAKVELTLDTDCHYNWLPFAVSGSPSGSNLCVVIRQKEVSGDSFLWTHVDNVSLTEETCTVPTITSITPNEAQIDSVVDDAQIVGAGFTAGATVRLQSGDGAAPDIAADDFQFIDAGNLRCDFSLSSPPTIPQTYALVVEVPGCKGNALLPGLVVTNIGPFDNGGFELADPGNDGCDHSPPTENGAPSRWENTTLIFGGNPLYRDGLASFPPSCPPQEGKHYASSYSPDTGSGVQNSRVHQTVGVTPDTTYTFSGYFAGGGNNAVTIELLDGNAQAGVLASSPVYSGTGPYDWTYATVSGKANGPLLTVQYKIVLTGVGPHAVHADDMTFEICDSPFTVSLVEPGHGVNDGTLSITNLVGTDFDTGSAAIVVISKGNESRNAANVVVKSTTRITCDVDLTGLSSGYYDVRVKQGGCVSVLAKGLLVVADALINGEFEDPDAPMECDDNELTTSAAFGWNYLRAQYRDHFIERPTCPRDVPGPGTHGHYGSLTSGEPQSYAPARGWQTVAARSCQVYDFGGWFAGGGQNKVTLRIVNGDISKLGVDEIASEEIYSCVDSNPGDEIDECPIYEWFYASVQGRIPSDADYVTLVWELTDVVDDSASHADGLTLSLACTHDVFADADDDGDVDAEDFGVFQLCFTGNDVASPPIPEDPAYCVCFDRTCDDYVSTDDLSEFELCASGPEIPANPGCQVEACCLPDAGCVELHPDECTQDGGVPQGVIGEGTTCVSVGECPWVGACCLPGGVCQEDMWSDDCIAADGAPRDPGSDCTAVCTEACCYNSSGYCIDVAPANCNPLYATTQGPGTACVPPGGHGCPP